MYLFSHITVASFPEFIIEGDYYTSPNQHDEPPTFSFSYSEQLPDNASPTDLRKRVWAQHKCPYLPFVLFSPFHGAMTSCLATLPEVISLVDDKYGYHLPDEVVNSWRALEQTCVQIAKVLRDSFRQRYPNFALYCVHPPVPSNFGYLKAYSTEKKARYALSESIDSFVLLFAYVSFCIAICREGDDPASISLSTSQQPKWYQKLSSQSSIVKPKWLQLLVDSPISDFTTTPERVGTIINVSQCPWVNLVPCLLNANIPVWLYWGIPPVFVQPFDNNKKVLKYAPRSHPQFQAPPLPSQSVSLATSSQSVSLATSSQSVSLATSSQSVRLPVRSAQGGPGQLPGESWKDFIVRQNVRRKAKISRESVAERQARKDRENKAATKSCPGKKGPTVFRWEVDDHGVWTRNLLFRREVEDHWSSFCSSQQIYNSIDNCWDLCEEFDEVAAGNLDEYDSYDSDNDVYRPKQSRRSPAPKNGSSGDGLACPSIIVDTASASQSVLTPPQVFSDCATMDVDQGCLTRTPPQISSDPPSMLVGPSDPAPQSLPTPAQVTSDPPSMLVDPSDPPPQSVPTPAQVASDPPTMPFATLEDLSSGDGLACPPIIVDTASASQSVLMPPQVFSDCATMDVDQGCLPPQISSNPPPSMLVGPSDPAPQSLPTPAQVTSDPPSMLVVPSDPPPQSVPTPAQVTSDPPSILVDPSDPPPQSVPTPAQVASDPPPTMPFATLEDLLYYRYGFSLKESPYTGIPSSITIAKTESFSKCIDVSRTVGNQHLEYSVATVDHRTAIEDFFSILVECADPFNDVPGKYWDLSPSGRLPIVDLKKVFINVEERQFTDGCKTSKHYIIRPRFLHPSQDTSWFISVNSMTALECIRRGLGPHTLNIANFCVSHGVRFHALQLIPNSPNLGQLPVRPHHRYLGYRPVGHTFDMNDFEGYELLRNSFLRGQSHAPLALRQGGIIARLAREVLPNSSALSGPSSEALSGHGARFIYNNEIYVEDCFSEAELGLICGTYEQYDPRARGNDFIFFSSCYN
jgi:hypothetical protein